MYQKIYTEKNYLREFDQKMIEFIKFNCKDNAKFDPVNLTLKVKKNRKTGEYEILTYPSVDAVLGVNPNPDGLAIGESSYLIH